MLSVHSRLRGMTGRDMKVCAHPDCRLEFDGPAFQGGTGSFYCSRACRAEMSDELTVEDRARLVS
jgi:hypothetical protein